MQFIFKATKYVIGTIRTWKDGRYEKKADGTWKKIELKTEEKKQESHDLKEAGISSVQFDDYVIGSDREKILSDLNEAFSAFNKKIGINFNDKLKIDFNGSYAHENAYHGMYDGSSFTLKIHMRGIKDASTVAHELGHAFEHKLNEWTKFSTPQEVEEVVSEFKKTKRYQKLLDEKNATWEKINNKQIKDEDNDNEYMNLRYHFNFIKYLLKDSEIFARCFNQYIYETVPEWRNRGFAQYDPHKDFPVGMNPSIKKVFEKILADPKVKKALEEVVNMDLSKAKKLVVGTIRKWKDGQYIKDNEHHWKLLEEVTHKIAEGAGVKKNHPEAKLLHKMAMSAVKHIKGHENPSKSAMHDHLDKHDEGTYENFDGLKGAVEHVLSQYVAEHKTLKSGKGEAETKTGQKQQAWADRLEEQKGKLSEAKLDIWVGAQFLKAKKPILHLLVAAREILRGKKNVDPSKGFDGLCHVILTRAYERGPDAFQPETLERFTKAFHTYFEKVTATEKSPSTDSEDKIEQLLKKTPYYQEHEEWFRYCVHRMMERNGAVSYSGLKPYMQNAMKKYNGVVPKYGKKKVKVARKKLVVKPRRRA